MASESLDPVWSQASREAVGSGNPCVKKCAPAGPLPNRGEGAVPEFFEGSSSGCPMCGGPADVVEVSIEFWRGGAEPLAIWVCEDPACAAQHPMVSHNV
jgi:hypothetical protein